MIGFGKNQQVYIRFFLRIIRVPMQIIVDNRERDLIEKLNQLKFEFKVECLDVGDIEVRESSGAAVLSIERKTFSDYEASIVDGRLKEQKFRLLGLPHRSLYVLEGSEERYRKRKRIHENAFRGSIMNTSIRDGMCIVRTRDLDDTAKLVTELERRLSKSKVKTGLQVPDVKASKGERQSKRSRMSDPKVILTRQLMCIPGVSENIATAVVKHCGSSRSKIKESAKKSELCELKVGKKKLGKSVVQRISKHL